MNTARQQRLARCARALLGAGLLACNEGEPAGPLAPAPSTVATPPEPAAQAATVG